MPTDDEILNVLRQGGGRTMPTYYIKNVLRTKHNGLQTAWVLRRLKALEKAGKAERAPSGYATMICWRPVNNSNEKEKAK